MEKEIKLDKIPTHIAFIMDGNGRWAKKRLLPRSFGHREGVKRIKETALLCDEFNVKVMTLFCFSTENWKRSKEEVDTLFSLFDEFFDKEINELHERNCIIHTMGDLTKLPLSTQQKIAEAKELTKNNTGIVLNICLNYGGHDDIVHACKEIVNEVLDKKLSVDEIDEKVFEKHLMSDDLPPVDLMIRTSGELRISNFCLWQLAYSELIFIDDYWPDFKRKQFVACLEEYASRNRRFGGIKYGNK